MNKALSSLVALFLAITASGWCEVAISKDPAAFSLDDYRGKVLLLEIGRMGCENSENGFGQLTRLSASPGEKPALVFVSITKKEADLKQFLDAHPASFPVYHDPDFVIGKRLEFQVIPTFYLIDKWGTVRYRGPWQDAKLVQAASALRAETQPTSASVAALQSIKEGAMAPSFAIPDASGQKTDSKTEIQKAKILLVVFGNEWCPYSHKAYQQLNALGDKFSAKGVRTVIIHTGKADESVRKYYADLKLMPPVLFDTEGKVMAAYGVDAVPTVFLIDPESVIQYRGLYDPQIESRISALLGGAAGGKTASPSPSKAGPSG